MLAVLICQKAISSRGILVPFGQLGLFQNVATDNQACASDKKG